MSSGAGVGAGVTFLGTGAGIKKVTPITSASLPEVSMDRIRIGYPAGYLRFFRIRIGFGYSYLKKNWIRTGSGHWFDFY